MSLLSSITTIAKLAGAPGWVTEKIEIAETLWGFRKFAMLRAKIGLGVGKGVLKFGLKPLAQGRQWVRRNDRRLAKGWAGTLGGLFPAHLKRLARSKNISDAHVGRYAELVKSNRPWSRADDFAESFTRGQRRTIRQAAIDRGLIANVPMKPGTKFPDFEAAGVRAFDELPPSVWKASDAKQFDWLDARLPGGVRQGRRGTTPRYPVAWSW